MMDKILLSKKKIRELQQEQHQIKEELLNQAIEKKDYGHMHEGIITEMNVAHKRKRINELNSILKKVKELPEKIESNKAVLGSWVEVQDGEGKITMYRLVHPIESNPSQGFLSVESELGKLLVGKKAGRKIKLKGKVIKLLSINAHAK